MRQSNVHVNAKTEGFPPEYGVTYAAIYVTHFFQEKSARKYQLHNLHTKYVQRKSFRAKLAWLVFRKVTDW